jgi:hypothetical protein
LQKKRNTLLKLLKFEKETLEEKIENLVKEKKEISVKIKQIELESLEFDLKRERKELQERIENLQREKKDVVRDMKIVDFMDELKCPKDFQCYNKKYEELCKTEYFGETKVLLCLAEEPRSCIFSLSFKDAFYCQCPLRNYIADEVER